MIHILKIIICSILIILFFHYLWNYIKDTYSTKKTKDLVGSQTQKYKNIINELLQQKKNNPTISDEDKQKLNDDLTYFLLEQTMSEIETQPIYENIQPVDETVI